MDEMNMQDISSLTSNIQQLEWWYDTWSKVSLGLGVLTATFGVLAAAAGAASYWYSVKLKPLQDEVGRMKEAQVQTELSKQQERAANAEKALLDIQERFQPRLLTSAQEEQFLAIVKEGPKGRVKILYAPSVPESALFATQIARLLIFRAGWTDVDFPEPNRDLNLAVGVQMRMTIANVEKRPPHAATLEKAFLSVGMGIGSSSISELPEGLIILDMGLKPGKY
jgi:hypothetical protein